MVLAAFRRGGVSLQHIRKAVSILDLEIGIEFDHADARQDDELAGLTEIVSRRRFFAPVVREYLKRIEYGKDAGQSVSPTTRQPIVAVDPRRAFGQPIFVQGAAPVESVVSWKAGESIAHVARDFGVPPADVEDYLRGAVQLAA